MHPIVPRIRFCLFFAAMLLSLWLWPELAIGFWPVLFFFPGCTCCGPSCTIFSDAFGSDDLATNYTQVDGSWSISGGVLTPPATGLLKINMADPHAGSGYRLSASFNFDGATGIARWIVDYVDADNYHFAEVECTDSTTAVLRIGERASGTDAYLTDDMTLSSFGWSTAFTVAICYSYTSLTAVTDSDWQIATVISLDGDYAGLATADVSATAAFDDLTMNKLQEGCDACTVSPTCSGNGATFWDTCFRADADFSKFTYSGGTWTPSGAEWGFCRFAVSPGDSYMIGRAQSANGLGRVDISGWEAFSNVTVEAIGAYTDQDNMLIGRIVVTNYAVAGGVASADREFTFWQRVGGVETQLGGFTHTDHFSLGGTLIDLPEIAICWNGTTAKCAFGINGGVAFMSDSSTVTGYRAGIHATNANVETNGGSFTAIVPELGCDC